MSIYINRVYTKAGDAGTTRLIDGSVVSKGSLRLESYGSLDEVNAFTGQVRTLIEAHARPASPGASPPGLDHILMDIRWIQNKLFDAGSLLASPPGATWEGMPAITEADVSRLEDAMDAMNEHLEPLRSFVLPGGGPISAAVHVARTQCRRAERIIVRLKEEEPVDPVILKYLNRLSDYFFVLGRFAAKAAGETEYLWER